MARATRGWLAAVGLGLVLVAGCGERERLLEGPRLDLRATLDPAAPAGEAPAATPAEPVAPGGPAPIALPAMVGHAAWTHRNGGPTHTITHPALRATPLLALAWTTPIGEGEGRRFRITADPVAEGGRIFTLDARAGVSAVGADGTRLWQRDLTPAGQRDPSASGGGLALGGGRLFVTTGFGRLVALDAASGDELWTQRFDAPVTAAPTVDGDLVYVVAGDGTGWAVDALNGRIRWQIPGTPAPAGMVGGPGPAVTDRMVLLPFASGEVVAALKLGGLRVWSATLAGQRRGFAYTGVSDITGDPVVVGDVAYVGTQSGRLAAFDLATGERRWTATEGALSPVWPVGGALFLVSDAGALVRLDAATGATVWSVPLPYWTTERERRRAAVHTHFGPVLAGGRLIVASGDGRLRFFDPVSGAETGSLAIPGKGAASAPIVVSGTLYVVTRAGELAAFR
ncbi:MAG: PQQ-binding-like beta-propeller repeat protein [Rhodobacteraceae bacterium]|nr:PQQ-binding-like beta-propeller repeat protein [Paracoccaceae bacterium]